MCSQTTLNQITDKDVQEANNIIGSKLDMGILCESYAHCSNADESDTIVYHGSTSIIKTIDVTKGKPYKDFGRGFYVTESKSHASSLALRNKRIEKERYGISCDAYLYTYKMNKTRLSGFNVKEFLNADFEWMLFVIANRRARNRVHNYDAANTLVPEGRVERL